MPTTTTVRPAREEIALLEVGTTTISPWVARALSFALIATIVSGLLLQTRAELKQERPFAAHRDLLQAFRDAAGSVVVAGPLRANRALLAAMHRLETALTDEFVGNWMRPPVQWLVTDLLGAGNEQVYPGRDGWLFYRPDVDHVIGPGFLDPEVIARRSRQGKAWIAAPSPDPRPALLDLQRDLAGRGIKLIVLLTPGKESIHPDRLSGHPSTVEDPIGNPSDAEFRRFLASHAIALFDAAPVLLEVAASGGTDAFLRTDTHWTPAGMRRVAAQLASTLVDNFGIRRGDVSRLHREPAVVRGTGDIARMLDLPTWSTVYPPEDVRVDRVTEVVGRPIERDGNSEVLLLGDSYSNVYSSPDLGFGSGAGLGEQLSAELGQPVDRLAVNAGGASASREALARELAAGRDRLATKRVVVYQFAARELSSGDWKRVPLDAVVVARSPSIAAGATVIARVRATARVPDPRDTPYRDCIAAIWVEVDEQVIGVKKDDILVYTWALRDGRVAPMVSSIVPGATLRVTLHPWSDVAASLETMQRVELEDEGALSLPVYWAESVEVP